MHELEQQLLDAHARNDSNALIAGYIEAADAQNDIDAACYFLTYAYVFALEAGDPRSSELHARLEEHERV